jgi:murein DD-endopeptidase MepM/ murein hydrolase activator NlpD
MKFSLKNTIIKIVLSPKPFTGGLLLILGLIFNIITNPVVAHAWSLSSFISDISGGVSDFAANRAQADISTSSASSSDSTSPIVSDGNDVLVAAVNTDPTQPSDCSVPVSDNSISPQLSSCTSASSTNTEISTYVVRPGDTLSEIANLFGVSVNTIVWVNDGLTRNSALKAGQTLVILPVSGIQYTIKKGDTIQTIANHYNVDSNEILQYNDIILSSVLNPGDTIIIPDAALEVPQSGSAGSSSGSSVKKTTAKSKWGTPGTEPAHNTNGPSYPGYYDLPLAHGIETQGLHGYNAVDLAAPRGTPILASAAGTVIISLKNGGWNGGYGNYVVINHPNGTQTLYAHMSKVLTNVGESVSQGETIGFVGMTGEATGPHVHFEIRGAHNPFANLTSW